MNNNSEKDLFNSFVIAYTKLEKTCRNKGISIDTLEKYLGANKYVSEGYKLELLRRIRNFIFHNNEWNELISLKSGSIGFLNELTKKVEESN